MKYLVISILSLCLVSNVKTVSASTVDGTIDATNRYAWSENAGWIDFGATTCAVHISDTEMTGYAYSENAGWISLNCSNTTSCASNAYKVSNDGAGNLSGYAWSENTGWIDFFPSAGGVKIGSSGIFSGSAYSENMGWINFDVEHPVTTDWRPAASRTTTVVRTSASGGRSTARAAAMVQASAAVNNVKALSSTLSTVGVDLQKGAKSPSVLSLQKYLNAQGFIVSLTGDGSPGRETAYFGELTRNALAQFQKAHGITPSLGYFGPKTQKYIKNNSL